jgi:hypothetical protein
MKIIGIKDYYDYLIGIYGIDPKVVLDRRTPDPQYKFISVGTCDIFRLYICGRQIEGVYFKDKFYYGDDLAKVGEVAGLSWRKPSDTTKRYYINSNISRLSHADRYVNAEIIKDTRELNKKEDCPILLEINNSQYYHYPILSNMELQKFIPAETIYNWLVDWISDKNEEKENQQISITDTQKLEAKGFNKKTSFRNIK